MSDEREIQPKDDRLAAGLRALGRPHMTVPQSADDAILAAARARLGRKRVSGRAAAWAVAAAVVLAVCLAVLLPIGRRQAVAPPATPAVTMDVNGDGRVDILDALALERKIEGRERLSLKWDINGDGRVDQKDVRAIAMFAVQPVALTLLPSGAARGASAPGATAHYWAMDVIVDADGQRLAAYQLEMTDPTGRSKIVGIEGGEHAAYSEPPYYDPAAMAQEGRVILAAFSTGKELPSGKTRVARLRVRTAGDGEPDFQAKLIVAATSDGRTFPAQVNIIAGEPSGGEY
ncbi:MAG: dockerin type I domain-containing protein [Candidatus Brocadiia bacterium]